MKATFTKFTKHVDEVGSYYVYDGSFSHHFEKWVMLPGVGRRYKMNENEYNVFMETTKAKFIGFCTYAQGIGLDPIG